MRIESGPTNERRVRNLLMLIMFAAMGGWFAYDGWLGYPTQNRREILNQIPAERRPAPEALRVYQSVKPDVLPAVEAALKRLMPVDQKNALEEVFGGPPSIDSPDAWVYVGPAFHIKVELAPGGVPKSPVLAVPAGHSEGDIAGQKYLGILLGVVSLVLTIFLLKVHRTRVVLDETGLVFNAVGPIPFEKMKSLKIDQYLDKGWVDLIYDVNGAARKLRLDPYHFAHFDEIIDELCSRRQFPNPRLQKVPVPA